MGKIDTEVRINSPELTRNYHSKPSIIIINVRVQIHTVTSKSSEYYSVSQKPNQNLIKFDLM